MSAGAATAERPGARPRVERRRERELLLRYRRTRDPKVRAQLVERLLPLAHGLARRYAGRGEPLEDLVQVAGVGLLNAIDRYDPERGTSFSSFAVPTILGELKRHFRDTRWAIHLPRSLQERVISIERASTRLSQTLGRDPCVAELADALDITPEEVLEGLEASRAYEAASLDAELSSEADPVTLAESLGEEDPRFELVDDCLAARRAWQALRPVERELLRLRFGHDLTQREIGERVGYSQMHVSRLLRRGVQRLEIVARAE